LGGKRIALVPGDDIDLVDLDHALQLHAGDVGNETSRRLEAIDWTSSSFKPNSRAIWRLERFSPMKYRHNTQTRSGW